MEKEIKELVEISKAILEEMKNMAKTMRDIRIRLVDKMP